MILPIRQKLKINLPDDLMRLFNIFDKAGKELGMAISAKEREIFLKMISEVRLLKEVVRQVVSEYYQLPGL